ncbi:RICIN domain-containing protein [Streptomyces sp. NPDC004787]|uniref:RICIN domain-containing protein n=1 Tax=unclassified Streptomyces TaxID=2593676 RepID=UPI0033AA58CB
MSFISPRRVRRGLLVLAASLGLLFGVTATPAQAAHVSDFTYTLSPKHAPGKCLEVADWRRDAGAPVRLWDCTGGANQKWMKFYENDPMKDTGVVWWVNLNSGMCLEIADWRTDNGAPARQWDCHWGANQQWTGNYTISAPFDYAPGKCLEIADWRTDNGAPARLWDCHYGANQQWSPWRV